MTRLTFNDVQRQIQALYQAEDYASALALAEEQQGIYPEQVALFTYWRICLTAQLDQNERSLDLLAGSLEQGLWYREVLLRHSPALKDLQNQPEFEALLERNQAVQAQDQAKLFPLLTLRNEGDCTPGGLPCPLLIALHANASSAQAEVTAWQPAAQAGWLVAMPQSTQAMWKDAYLWDDLEITLQEIQTHFNALDKGYQLDPERIVLSGNGMGAEVAIWLALGGAIPARGFLAINPDGPFTHEPQGWLPWLEAAQERYLRGVILCQEDHPSYRSGEAQSLVEKLNTAGIDCLLESIDTEIKPVDRNYLESLLGALGFIVD